jgi:hypothetical protein
LGVDWEDAVWKELWRGWNPIDGDCGMAIGGTGDGAGEGAKKGGGTDGTVTWEALGVGCANADIDRNSGCADACRTEGGGEEMEMGGPDRAAWELAGGEKKEGDCTGCIGGAGERIWVL